MISGRFARFPYKPPGKNEVELLIVGDVILPELAKIIQKIEGVIKREINYTVMSVEEFQFRKKRRDPFILSILWQPRIMVVGDELELIKDI